MPDAVFLCSCDGGRSHSQSYDFYNYVDRQSNRTHTIMDICP